MNRPTPQSDIIFVNNLINTNISNNNVIGSSICKKVTNGIETDTICYQFFVKNKIPINQLRPEEILPNTIIVDGTEYVTDVAELTDVQELGCYDWFEGQTPATSSPEQLLHRVLTRPLQGGISIINYTDFPSSAGTVGLFAKDLRDGSVVGVTNGHVIVRHKLVNNEKNSISNTYSKNVSQPGTLDQAFVAQNHIGIVKRYYPNEINNSTIDAALINIDNTINISDSQLNLALSSNLPWATDGEINGLISNNIILSKSGRTTGSVGGLAGCNIVATNLNLTVAVGGGAEVAINFTDCIGLTYANRAAGVVVGGDSGSALLGDFGGIIKVVGLIFAGGANKAYGTAEWNWGVACKITNIANLLNIEPLNGTNTRSNTSNWRYKASVNSAHKSLKNVMIDGKLYWQIGNCYL